MRALLFLAIVAATACKSETPRGATVAAASSLRRVVPALFTAYEQATSQPRLSATYGASGTLRQQVEAGAPIDAVLFASGDPVDRLIDRGHADRASRRVAATNSLVLIGPTGSRQLRFEQIEALAPTEKLAMGEPGAVPAGHYAKQAFDALGKWPTIEDRLVFGGDVAMVLAYVRRGEVAAGVVYETEIRDIDGVEVLDRAAGGWAPRPQVVVAAIRGGDAPEQGRQFLDFVLSERGQSILRSHGFSPP